MGTVRITQAGAYVEETPPPGVRITQAGAYVEGNLTARAFVTQAGAYIEFTGEGEDPGPGPAPHIWEACGMTLQDWRRRTANAAGAFYGGVATGGSVNTLIDTAGLARFTEAGSLIGSLVYLEDGAGLTAPAGEARPVVGHDASTQTLTLESDVSAAIASGQPYHLFRVPLSLQQWDQVVNDAIDSAWPAIWRRAYWTTTTTEATRYPWPEGEDVGDIVDVQISDSGIWRTYSMEQLAAPRWRQEDGVLKRALQVLTPLPTGRTLYVFYKAAYDCLTFNLDTTDLDAGYLRAAALTNLYHTLAAEASLQAATGHNTQLMNYWQNVADTIRDRLQRRLEPQAAPRPRRRERAR